MAEHSESSMARKAPTMMGPAQGPYMGMGPPGPTWGPPGSTMMRPPWLPGATPMYGSGQETSNPEDSLLSCQLRDALTIKDAANSSLLCSLSSKIIKSLSKDTETGETQNALKHQLASLISQSKFDEAFSQVLESNDKSALYWLCSEVDLLDILSLFPLPLSQIVLLTILQTFSSDLYGKTSVTPEMVNWITHLAAAIDPMDPIIAGHVKPVFEKLYNRCCNPTMKAGVVGRRQFPSIRNRVLLQVLKSVLAMCT